MNNPTDIPFTTNFIENFSDFKNFEVILDSLPFGISVQNINRTVLYENQMAKNLTGSFKLRNCFNRWEHLPDEGDHVCKDCPATISLLDKNPHKIFRKTLSKNSEELFLEIQVVPILEKDGSINNYVEILTDISKLESAKVLINKPAETLVNELQLSFSKYGLTGGEIVFNDELSFLSDKIPEYIQKLTMFTYIGVFQNNFNQEGLFGPLPVLDKPEKSMMVYSFRLNSKSVTDPRKEGKEPCLLMLFFDRDNYFMFEKRNLFLEFFNKRMSKIEEIEDLDYEWYNSFKKDLKKLILQILNGFDLEIF